MKSAMPKLATFEYCTLPRAEISLQSGNPRFIDRHARTKLKAGIKRHGLVEPLVVNLRLTENGWPESEHGVKSLTSGHQRLSCADELTGYDKAPDSKGYDVPVALIRVSPAREAELTILLNNPGTQGQWDVNKLEAMLLTPGVDLAATGFERQDLGLMFDSAVLGGLFGDAAKEQAAAERPIVDELAAMRLAGQQAAGVEAGEGAGNGQSNPSAGPVVDLFDPPDTAAATTATAPIPPDNDIEGMKHRRVAYQSSEATRSQNESEYMLILVAEHEADVDRVLARLGLPVGNRYVPLGQFLHAAGVEL